MNDFAKLSVAGQEVMQPFRSRFAVGDKLRRDPYVWIRAYEGGTPATRQTARESKDRGGSRIIGLAPRDQNLHARRGKARGVDAANDLSSIRDLSLFLRLR